MSDETLNHPAVKAYRDQFKFCPNKGFRSDIISTVKDMELWKKVLSEWKANKWNPFKPQWMISEYERRAAKQSNGSSGEHCKREGLSNGMQARVPEWRDTDLPSLRDTAGSKFRGDNPTLDEILAKALREVQAADRS